MSSYSGDVYEFYVYYTVIFTDHSERRCCDGPFSRLIVEDAAFRLLEKSEVINIKIEAGK